MRGIIAGHVVNDLDRGHRAGDLHQHRVAIGGRRLATAIGAHAVARHVNVAPAGQHHRHRVAIGIEGKDRHRAVIVDIVDPELDVLNLLREGQADLGIVAAVIALHRQAGIAIGAAQPAGVDPGNVLAGVLVFHLGVVALGQHREGHVDAAGVLGEARGIALVGVFRGLVPLEHFAGGGGGAEIGIAMDHVVAAAAVDVIVARPGKDLVIARACFDHVIAGTGVDDIVIAGFTRQDRIARVDPVAVGVPVTRFDQVVPRRARNDTVFGAIGHDTVPLAHYNRGGQRWRDPHCGTKLKNRRADAGKPGLHG